jgi:hypothetical protein
MTGCNHVSAIPILLALVVLLANRRYRLDSLQATRLYWNLPAWTWGNGPTSTGIPSAGLVNH